jgi:hypothetical protein
MRLLAVLDRLADDRHAGRVQELAQLAEIVALFERGDAERALPGASCSGIGAGLGLTDPALARSLHRLSLMPCAASTGPGLSLDRPLPAHANGTRAGGGSGS